jgi:Protein of unknown function (DUF2934)
MKPKKSEKTSQKPARRITPGSQTPLVSEDLYEQIAKRAYEIYERRIHQGALDDWLLAEREILRQKKTWNPEVPHRGGYATQEQE